MIEVPLKFLTSVKRVYLGIQHLSIHLKIDRSALATELLIY